MECWNSLKVSQLSARVMDADIKNDKFVFLVKRQLKLEILNAPASTGSDEKGNPIPSKMEEYKLAKIWRIVFG